MAGKCLTEYERLRLQNIRRNDEVMNTFRVMRKASDFAASVRPPPRKKIIKPQSSSPVVVRRSPRYGGPLPNYSLISRGKAASHSRPTAPPALQQARKRRLISIEEAWMKKPNSSSRRLVGAIMDISDRSLLRDRNKQESTWNPSGAEDWGPTSTVFQQKTVKNPLHGYILSVSFFPVRDKIMIVAGDTFGRVGFWDLDHAGEGGDGTYTYMPHSSTVSGILIHPFYLTKIFTSSYDGFIRLMDAEKDTFNLIYSSDNPIFSVSQQSNDKNLLYFGEGHGNLKVWDERIGGVSSSWNLHGSRINSIHFNIHKFNSMVTSSSDGTACIWDLRRISKIKPKNVKTILHTKQVHSAYLSPTGRLLATTSDDHIGIFSGEDFSDASMIAHSGKMICRAVWGWDDDYLYVGNNNRAVDVISSHNKTVCSLKSPHTQANACCIAIHPYKMGYIACTAGLGHLYLWTR